MSNFSAYMYLIGAVCFILSLQGLSSAQSAEKGYYLGIGGMVLAVITTLMLPSVQIYSGIACALILGGGVGGYIARRIPMTALPQLVAAFHSLVGLSAVCVAGAVFLSPEVFGVGIPGYIYKTSLAEMSIGSAIGALTFTGSLVACAKLQGLIDARPLKLSRQHHVNAFLAAGIAFLILLFVILPLPVIFCLLTCAAFLLGVLLILPIGGADMPVVISMLNSYSGWAAAGIGLTLSNNMLIITGALVGSSGAILSYIMCKGMNRSILHVIVGGVGAKGQQATSEDKRPVKSGNAEDAAFVLKNARSVIIVPGYGMAVAQAQHSLREMADLLRKENIQVRYAIHPVAGRMPGHMNVLLAEASVPYEDVLELEEINPDFNMTDVVYVIGANDVTNPAAKTDPSSPIYGMPVLDVEKAKTILFVKRSMGAGYAGVDNPLFYHPHTMMLFGDAKKMTEQIIKALE